MTATEFELDDLYENVDAGTGETPPDSTTTDTLYGKPADEPTGEKQPTQRKEARASAAGLVTLAWGGMGAALVKTGADVPVGRVLQWQAPMAGAKIDQLIAHTWIDQVLQPFVKQAEKIEGLGALITLPIMIGAWERNPELQPIVQPLVEAAVHDTLIELAPLIKKQKQQEKRAAESLKGIHEALGIDKDMDPVQAILETIFAPAPQKQPPVQDGAE